MDSENKTLSPIPWRSWVIAAITGAGAFMAMLDSTVANLALESIRTDFSSTLSSVQWVTTGYLCALAVSLPASAWLGVRYGYGRVWAFSLAIFVVASMLCAISPSPSTLITGRLLQGLAGGLMVPAGQAVIASTIDKKQLGRIFGLLGLVVALGPAIGPAVGGYLLDVTSWRWLFWINVPIGLAALIAARGFVPGGSRDASRTLDVQGLILLGAGLPLLLYGAMKTGSGEITATTTLLLGTGVALTVIFVFASLQKSKPLIDLRLLKRKAFCTATITTGLTGANMYAGLLMIPLYLQLGINISPTETGMWLLVMGLGSAFVLPVAGALMDRYGGGVVTLAGAALLLISTLPFLVSPLPSPGMLAVAMLARGAGMALAQMPAMTAAYTSVDRDEMGDATTLVNIVQRLGGVLGAVGVVIILQQTSGGVNPDAYMPAFIALAVLSAMTLVSAGMLRRPA